MEDCISRASSVNFDQLQLQRKRTAVPLENNRGKRCRFLEALIPVIWLAKVFGVLPLTIEGKNVRFRWISLSFLYWIVTTSILAFYMGVRISSVFLVNRRDNWIEIAQNICFYMLQVVACFFLLRLAKKFPNLVERYSELEQKLNPEVKFNYKKTILILMTVFMLSATGETVSAKFYKINEINPENFTMYLKQYTKRGNEGVVKLMGFSNALAITTILFNGIATFIWNYVDLIISVIAITLTSIMKEFNQRLEKAGSLVKKGETVNWVPFRRLHMQIYYLNTEVENAVGFLILQSYASNLFFILIQVYNGLKTVISSKGLGKYDSVDMIYLTWSFLHLTGRLVLVTFTCANFHHSSTEVHPTLMSLYQEDRFPDGIQRLIHQMENLTFGLSGVGFFLISKNFFVAIVGALITYEVILLQMNPTGTAFTRTPNNSE